MEEETKQVVPQYVFVESSEGEDLPPVKRQIAKTMEITEHFRLYDVYAHLGALDKRIDEFQENIKALTEQKKNFLDELDIIEKALGISEMESEYNRVKAEEATAANENKDVKNA